MMEANGIEFDLFLLRLGMCGIEIYYSPWVDEGWSRQMRRLKG